LWAAKAKRFGSIFHGRFLSFGGGVAISYVFIDILPKLGKSDSLFRKLLLGIIPYFERHVFVMALLGFLLFFCLDKTPDAFGKKGKFWLSIVSYALFNFLVGYAVVDKDNPEVQPILLFTIAMGLHYFTNDYSLSEAWGSAYKKTGRWVLIASLFLGWFAGLLITLSQLAVALVSAFIGGGVIMNVTRHELPKEDPGSLGVFLLSAITYTAILLTLH
jgi:hypothetical protein